MDLCSRVIGGCIELAHYIPALLISQFIFLLSFYSIYRRAYRATRPVYVRPKIEIIGLTGKKRAGKDTLGEHLVKHYGYVNLAYGDVLKTVCHYVFGLTESQLFGPDKEVIDSYWKISPRQIMQVVGTELFRDKLSEVFPEIGQNIWIRSIEQQIINGIRNGQTKFVITDCRFPNELEFIKNMKYCCYDITGTTIKIVRHGLDQDTHQSEQYSNDMKTDFVIYNNYSIEDLFRNLDEVMGFINNDYPIPEEYPDTTSAEETDSAEENKSDNEGDEQDEPEEGDEQDEPEEGDEYDEQDDVLDHDKEQDTEEPDTDD